MTTTRTHEQRALPLAEAIYRAAMDDDAWPDFVQALSDDLGGAGVGMPLVFPGWDLEPQYYEAGGLGEGDYGAVFEKHFRRGLPWGDVSDSLYRGGFGRASQNFPDRMLEDTDWYREFMQPLGLAPEGPVAHVIEVGAGRPVSGIAIMRRVGGRSIDDDDVATCNLLVPHLSNAMRIRSQRQRSEHQRGARTEILDRIPTGILLVDRELRCIITNRTGQRILDEADGLSLEDGRLRVAQRRDREQLAKLVGWATRIAEPAPMQGVFLGISRPSGRRAYAVAVARLFGATPDTAVGDRAAVVFLTDPAAGQVSIRESFQKLYGLSPAESELVSLLAEGEPLEAISRIRGVRLSTTRTQLKRVFAKTQTRRQGEIVRLALTGVASRGDPPDGVPDK